MDSGRVIGKPVRTAWANRALLQRAGITTDFLKKLSAGSGITMAWIKTCSRTVFWSTPARRKSNRCCLKPTPERLLAARRAALQYNHGLGITAREAASCPWRQITRVAWRIFGNKEQANCFGIARDPPAIDGTMQQRSSAAFKFYGAVGF